MPEENSPATEEKSASHQNQKEASQAKPEESDEIAINPEVFKKISGFLFTHKVYLLILIPIIITFYIRLLPAEQPITYDWARNSVYNFYRGQIDAGVSQQYPNLPNEQKERIIAQELSKVYSAQAQVIEQQVQQVANQFRQQFSYESNGKLYPLLGDLDSYYWLRFARNLEQKGTICDEKINGVCYDTYTTAPLKSILDGPYLHTYSIYLLYKIFRIFNNSINMMHASFLAPLVFALLSVIFVFIMVKRLSGTLGALVASILVAVNPTFLSRSFGSDNDVYNIFFPAIILWLTFEAFNAKKLRNVVLFTALVGIFTGIYSYAWSGWWYTFMFTLVAIIINIGYIVLMQVLANKKLDFWKLTKDDLIRNSIVIFFVLLLVVGIMITIIYDFKTYLFTFKVPVSVFGFKVATAQLWPNVLTTVAEFGGSSISSGISQVGGKPIFILAILGIILLMYKKLNDVIKNIAFILFSLLILIFSVSNAALSFSTFTYVAILSIPILVMLALRLKKIHGLQATGSSSLSEDFRGTLLLFFMVISALFAVTQGNRFALLLVIPISIGAGFASEFIYRFTSGLVSQLIKQKVVRNIAKLALFLVIILLLVKKPYDSGISIGKAYMPSVNRQWIDALTYIKDNSKPDAIINSWWDFGHWFKYFADRRVTLDGSSQNNPQLHWLGKLILTPDENVSVGILRMLDCGANTAFEVIDRKVNFSPTSIKILNEIIPINNKSIAKEILSKNGFSNDEADEVLKYSHCNPPEDFYITSGDMVHKSGVWAHFGGWDFDKAYQQDLIRKSGASRAEAIAKLQSGLNMSFEAANSIYDEVKSLGDEGAVNAWISPWPGYASGVNGCQRIANDTIACPLPQQGAILVNLTSMDAYIPTQQGNLRPNNLLYKANDTLAVKNFENNTFGLGMLLISDGGNYASVFASPQVVPSMFSRLFFLDGHGTKYYKKVFDVRDAAGLRIIVWKIEWP